MRTLGVSMIVRNESGCIRECLNSIRDADEIVIVDTGSKDNTVDICREYTSKVYSYTGCNDEEGYLADFSDARNYSLARCTSDWILIIDADEIFKDSIKGLRHVINSGSLGERLKDGSYKYYGLSMRVKTKTEELISLRVLRNDPGVRYIYPFHNQVAYKGNIGFMRQRAYESKFKIDSGYSPAHYIDPDRTLRMINYRLKSYPNEARSLYYQAREYLNRALPKEGRERLEAFDQVIGILEHLDRVAYYETWTNEYADGLFVLANCYIEKLALTQDMKFWYPAVWYANKAVLILPTFQAPMLLLAQLMVQTPDGFKHRHGIKFWSESAKKASNEDVAFLREVPQIIKKK